MVRHISFITVILLFAGAKNVLGGDDIKGRLLTPKEGCGYSKVGNKRIIGGSDAPVGAWPWIAILGYSENNKIVFHCDGSLITSRHVLTAAHCAQSHLRIVRLGEHDLRNTDDGPHEDISVVRAVNHTKYDALTYVNDIAILHLERDVEFSDRIHPVCLPLDEPLRSREFVGESPFVAGWGNMYESGWKARVLQQLQVPVVDLKTCQNLHLRVRAPNVKVMINEHVICAGGVRGKGFWAGDSGGPLMLPIHQNGSFPFYQIGIVSFSFGCARENGPGVYSKVQYHADWIKEQLLN